MKNRVLVYSLVLATLGGGMACAQAPSDAYRNVQKELSGTARAQALSGAVGAFGADATAVSINPAGSALFTGRTLSLTAEAGVGNANSIWKGHNSDFTTSDKWVMGMVNNFSLFSSLIDRSVGTPFNVNWGFSYNRDYGYRRNYGMINSAPPYGLTDYMAFEASRIEAPSKTDYIIPIVDIARDARWIEHFTDDAPNVPEGSERRYRTLFSATKIGFKPSDGVYELFTPAASRLSVQESGYKNNYDLNLSFGILDKYYFGANLVFTSSLTSRRANYLEDFYNDYNNQIYKSNLSYTTELSVSGSSVGLNLGALVAIGDYGRIGLSYTLPQFASYEERYSVEASGNNAAYQGSEYVKKEIQGQESSYRALLPGRLSVSALAFLGRYGFVAYDYQMRRLGGTKLFQPQGGVEISESAFIQEDFGLEHSHHVGLEVRPISMVKLRAGYSYTGNPMKAEQLRQEPEEGLSYNYVPSGYITDFVLPRSYQTISAGVGFSFTKRTSLDLAYVYGKRTEKVYPFSGSSAAGMIVDEANGKVVRDNVHMAVKGADLTTNKHKFVATLNFRF